MSSKLPATVNLSLEELARHGGDTGPHADGWGLAYINGREVQEFREPDAASRSELLPFVSSQRRRGEIVVSHIRKATMGEKALYNTQPFSRELGGRLHLFAHNGDLVIPEGLLPARDTHCRPVGNTDSEQAFCVLLDHVHRLWQQEEGAPEARDRSDAVSRFAAVLRDFGPANFIYTDGQFLFAHGHVRTQPDGHMGPPGLYMLHRSCPAGPATWQTEGVSLAFGEGTQEVTLFASVPLTEENWIPLGEGEVVVVERGRVVGGQGGPVCN